MMGEHEVAEEEEALLLSSPEFALVFVIVFVFAPEALLVFVSLLLRQLPFLMARFAACSLVVALRWWWCPKQGSALVLWCHRFWSSFSSTPDSHQKVLAQQQTRRDVYARRIVRGIGRAGLQ